MSWRPDAMYSDIFSVGRRPDGPGATWTISTHGRVPHGPSVGGPGQSPHIPQEKGVPIGRFATQSRHSGFDTISVTSVSVCVTAMTKSHHSSSSVVSVLSRVWRGRAPGTTHEGHSGGGDRGQWSRLPEGRAEKPCGCDSRPRVTSPVS